MYGLFTVHLSTSVRRTPSVALYGSFDYLWAILGGFALFPARPSELSFEGSALEGSALLLQQQLELDKSTLSFYSVGPAPLPGGPVVSFSVLRQPSPVYFGAPGESPSLAPGANAGAVRYAQAACTPEKS